ncbi:hypothetical protein IGI04_032227 [Brassica rapa subsp. trilocularis]|uniref:Uncharacterized protein n=1 Tax=Brassica rapa subsp. trilocularis TaxID=1813537 RepID=A0ABQ7LYD9_BRACM|nr:hypothetical protein IGI04_032227 [Brassica rapa subsp. trilocularis]
MEILLASTPLGISSSSNTTLCGNPALFLNTIFSPLAIVNSLGTKANAPSPDPKRTSMAMAFPAKAMEAAAATAATPKSLRDAFTVRFRDAVVGSLTTAEGLEIVDLRPVNDGIATVAEVTEAMMKILGNRRSQQVGEEKEYSALQYTTGKRE